MKIQNKELLISAINNHDKYTKSQKKILSLFASLQNEGIVETTIISVASLVNITRAMVYKNITLLVEEGIIIEQDIQSPRVKKFLFNDNKLQEIIDIHLRKQEFIKSQL